jgi:hypothetical protein
MLFAISAILAEKMIFFAPRRRFVLPTEGINFTISCIEHFGRIDKRSEKVSHNYLS